MTLLRHFLARVQIERLDHDQSDDGIIGVFLVGPVKQNGILEAHPFGEVQVAKPLLPAETPWSICERSRYWIFNDRSSAHLAPATNPNSP